MLTVPCGSAEGSLHTTCVIPFLPLKPSAYSCPCHLHFHYHWLYFKVTSAVTLHHTYMYFRVVTSCTVEYCVFLSIQPMTSCVIEACCIVVILITMFLLLWCKSRMKPLMCFTWPSPSQC